MVKIASRRYKVIKLNVSKLMGERKMNIQKLSDLTGLSRTTISNLYHENITRLDFETLEKLLLAFECSVSDLIEHISDKD